MSKIENNRIYYDPYNEIRCDKFALEKFIKESEEKDKTIADLEAKLAESEIRNKESEIFYKREIDRRDTKLRNIKQQLAEKDEEINVYKKYIKVEDQEKISFCIEQLEKVKEELDKHDKIETFVDIYGDSAVNRSDLEFFIDNQIKQLKEQNDV